MCLKLVIVAAASIALAACSTHALETDGYLYPNFWRARMASVSSSPSKSDNQDVANATATPADTGIFGTHVQSVYSPSIWLFPPDELDGGSN
jgi:hypothetical protein